MYTGSYLFGLGRFRHLPIRELARRRAWRALLAARSNIQFPIMIVKRGEFHGIRIRHACAAPLASRLLVDLAARHPRRRDVHARPGKDGRCTRGTRARKMDTGKWGGRTPISRGVWDRGPEMRPAGAALPFRLSHYAAPSYRPSVPGEASVPGDRDDGQSERGSTNGKRMQEHPELARGVAASRGGASVSGDDRSQRPS